MCHRCRCTQTGAAQARTTVWQPGQQQLLKMHGTGRQARWQAGEEAGNALGWLPKARLGIGAQVLGLVAGVVGQADRHAKPQIARQAKTHAKSQRLATVRARLSYQSDREAELQNAYAALLRDD